MKGISVANFNTGAHKNKLQGKSGIEKKLQSKIKNEDIFTSNLNPDNCVTYSEFLVNKNIASKNNRTFSMDLSNSVQLKEGASKILQGGINYNDFDDNIEGKDLKESKEVINFNGKKDSKHNKESRNENSLNTKSNLTSVLKEFNTINSKMKNTRTNSIALYNLNDYHTGTSTNVSSSAFNSNLQHNIINTNLFSNYNTTNKKLLTKTNSGNATTFSRYLANANINSATNVNKSVNKSGLNVNASTNITMHSTYNTLGENSKKNNSLSVTKKETFNPSSGNKLGISNNNSIKKTSSSKRKEIRHKLKVSFPTNNSKSKISTANPSVLNTHSNDRIRDNTNSLNISRDLNKSPLIISKNYDDDDNEIPLTNETKMKLAEIRYSIIELLNNNKNKNLILRELENIYKYVVKSNSPIINTCEDDNLNSIVRKSNVSSSSASASISHSGSITFNRNTKRKASEKEDNLIEFENELLKKENENLKNKIETIDKKFDKICTENHELREYVKEKSDNIEELRNVLNSFKQELNEVKKQSNNMKSSTNTPTVNLNLIDTLRSEKVEFSVDDKNISIDQIPDLYSKNKININNIAATKNNHQPLSVPIITISKKNDEIVEDENDRISDVDRISDKERTACFADVIGREEFYNEIPNNENTAEESLTLDSLNRMTRLIEEQTKSRENQINMISKSTDFSNKNMIKNFGLNLTNLPKQSDFNQEFLENYADFSPSWRKEVEKINLSKNFQLNK